MNDDFTPMEFVVSVLQDHLGLDPASATQVMLEIHKRTAAACSGGYGPLIPECTRRIQRGSSPSIASW